MKKYCFFALALVIALFTLNAQSFKIFTKDGKAVEYSNDDVVSVEFDHEDTPDLKFDDHFTAIHPEEGTVDLEATPLGIGRISIEMKGIFIFNEKCRENVTIASESEVIYDFPATEHERNQCYHEGGVMGNATDFIYVVDNAGYTTPGTYTLTIPDGYYLNYDGGVLGGKTFTFTIEAPAPEQSFTVVPAEGVVASLQNFEFTFDNYKDLQLNSSVSTVCFLYKDGSTTPYNYATPIISGTSTFKLNFTSEVTEGGIYSVVVPAGVLKMKESVSGKEYTNDEIRATYQIEGGKASAPLVGDFYYSDGTWSTSLLKKDGVVPVGVVFYVGVHPTDRAAYYTSKDGKSMAGDFHGYVVSITNATPDNTGVAWSFWDGSDKGCGGSLAEDDFMGYTNSLSIKDRADKNYNGLSANESTNFPATYYAMIDYENNVPAPAQSSGWFLPSAGQANYLMTTTYYLPSGMPDTTPCVEKSLQTLKDNGYKVTMLDAPGTRYWTSTESMDSYGDVTRVKIMRTGVDYVGGVALETNNKNRSYYVRSILAF